MPVDAALLERTQTVTIDVERGRLRMFAEAIGETDPVYLDAEAARAAGHRDVIAAPTALFGLELERSDTFELLAAHGADLQNVLHGEQTFTYHHPVHAGDRLTFRSSFTRLYEKASGALQFIVRHTDVERDGQLVAEMDNTAILREVAR